MDFISNIKNKKRFVTILLSIILIIQILSFSSVLSLVGIVLSGLLIYFVQKNTIKSISNARTIIFLILLATLASSSTTKSISLFEGLFMIIIIVIITMSYFLINSIYSSLISPASSPDVK